MILRAAIPPVTWLAIGRIFNLSPGTISKHVSAKDWTGVRRGRPATLPDEVIIAVRRFIIEQFQQAKPATFGDINEFILDDCHISISQDTLRHVVHRLPGFKVINGIPTEAERVHADEREIQAYFANLARIFSMEDIPAAMIVNLDEAGHCDWVDARHEKVVVPDEFTDSKIPIPVKRQTNRYTLLGAISASGTSLKPLVIVNRQTIETELYKFGYTRDRVILAQQENAFITADLFNECAEEVLFPYFEITRQTLGYSGRGFLLLDGFSSHSADWFLDEATYTGVETIFFPPHSSDQVRPMDLGIFALEKTEAARCRPHRNLNSQTRKIIKMVDAYGRATTPNNIVSSFRRAGIVSEWQPSRGALIARVDQEHATQVRDWQFSKKRIVLLGE
jgi:hypothetical protein